LLLLPRRWWYHPRMPDLPTFLRALTDTLAALFTIVTGMVLAVAALFAYLIQRQRYLLDAAPDLHFPRDLSVISPLRKGSEGGPGYRFSFTVRNQSTENVAYDLALVATVTLTRSNWTTVTEQRESARNRLLPGREWTQFGTVANDRWSGLDGEKARILLTMELEYSARVPWFVQRSGRHVHYRAVTAEWQLEADGLMFLTTDYSD
jgi:hypothetical protein